MKLSVNKGIGSNMPEIQEESEVNKSPAMTKAMSLASELDHSNNRTFDLSIV